MSPSLVVTSTVSCVKTVFATEKPNGFANATCTGLNLTSAIRSNQHSHHASIAAFPSKWPLIGL